MDKQKKTADIRKEQDRRWREFLEKLINQWPEWKRKSGFYIGPAT